MGKNKKNRSRINKIEKPIKQEKKKEEWIKEMFQKYKYSRIGNTIINQSLVSV
jgi:hypothetical protein